MKRMMWFLAALSMVLLMRLPGQSADVAELEPVETVLVCRRDGGICITTDTGATGTGENLPLAVEDLNRHASGRIFLDTADYLLVEGEDISWEESGRIFLDTADYLLVEGEDISWEELYPVFRPGCWVCRASGVEDLEAAGAFLKIHPPSYTLLQLCAEERQAEYPPAVLYPAAALRRGASSGVSITKRGGVGTCPMKKWKQAQAGDGFWLPWRLRWLTLPGRDGWWQGCWQGSHCR